MSDRELLDEDGENQAVRMFLALYGSSPNAITIWRMREHLKMCGFDGCWPAWAGASRAAETLTKAGAQSWLRYLFSLESAAAAPQSQGDEREGA